MIFPQKGLNMRLKIKANNKDTLQKIINLHGKMKLCY